MKYNINKLIRILEEVTKRKVILEDELPSFLSYDNLFVKNTKNEEVLDEDEDDGDVITKPKPKVKPSPTIPKPKKRPSPLTPTHPVTQPKPKSLKEATKNDDPFFQPKGIDKREEVIRNKLRKIYKEISSFKSLSQVYKWLNSDESDFFQNKYPDLFEGGGSFEQFLFQQNPNLIIDPPKMVLCDLGSFWANLVYNTNDIPNKEERADFIYRNYFKRLKRAVLTCGDIENDTADGKYNFN